MTIAPMSKRLALGELIVMCVSYAIGLAIVLLVLDLPAGQIPSLLVGLVLFLASYAVLYWLLARRLPPPLGSRPWLYSIPLGIAIVLAVVWTATSRSPDAADVATLIGAIPVLMVGEAVSSLWWSTAGPARAA